MYVPAQFRSDDDLAGLRIIREHPFAILISVADGKPITSHLPFIIGQTRPRLVLTAHCARANPHWKHLNDNEAVVIFSGPHGYISARWYSDPTRDVPTWNYAVVRCTGVARLAGKAEAIQALTLLTDQMEHGAAKPWRVAGMDTAYRESLIPAIVPFSIEVAEMTTKLKLSQNRSDVDFKGATSGLLATGREADRLLAEEMIGTANRRRHR
ncbi:MAG: FMN-binding negative transcriptional regulator [Candidatus Eremiobacteraeota bacterium]|nr:FMN-binding negative transcriptional regulator [Candidatus Eremiobacteraeota bacterium]